MTQILAIAVLATTSMVAGRVSSLGAQARAARTPVAASLTVLARNDLLFGTVLRGIPARVSAQDVAKAAAFEIQGPADASIRIEFVLPAALNSDHGALLPLHFGPRDGFVEILHLHSHRGHLFDPGGPLITTLGGNGRLFIRLGGTALPAQLQPSGTYRATIFLSVYDLGS